MGTRRVDSNIVANLTCLTNLPCLTCLFFTPRFFTRSLTTRNPKT